MDQWSGRTGDPFESPVTYEEAQERIEGAEGDYREEILLLNRLAQNYVRIALKPERSISTG